VDEHLLICDKVKVILFIENKTTIHYLSYVDDLLYNENKIMPRIIIETFNKQQKNQKFTMTDENNNEEMIEKRRQ
jgi:hypothetical protein